MNRFLRWLDAWWPLVWKNTYQYECQHTERMEAQNWEHLDRIAELNADRTKLSLRVDLLQKTVIQNAKAIEDLEQQIRTDLEVYQKQRANWMIETNSKDETIKSLRKFAQSVRFAFSLMTNPEQPTGMIDACVDQKTR